MRNLLLILLCLPIIVSAQITSPSVISSSGNTYFNGNIIMDYTLGEVVIETHLNGPTILTQGFHQEILKVTTQVENIDLTTKIYPNPTTSFLIIELEKNITADILVYDINGKLVIEDKLDNQHQKELDFSFLKQGNYLLHINVDDRQSVYQINKTR
tara:strand:+ start:77 stop:544 length:468 start_codon:yes stop_codon:yes gene_type:complete